MKTVRFFIRWLRGCRAIYFAAFLCVLISSAVGLFSPYLIRVVIDYILGNLYGEASALVKSVIVFFGGREYILSRLYIPALILVAATFCSGAASFGYGVLSAKASQKSVTSLRVALFDHIQRLPYEELVKLSTGDIIQRCTSDIETVRRFLSNQMISIGRIALQLIGIFVIMFNQQVSLAIVSIPLLPVVFGFSIIYLLRMRPVFKKTDEAEGEMMSVLQENLTGVKVVRAFGRQRFEIDKFEKESRNFRDLDLKLGRMQSVFWAVSDAICMLQIAAIILAGSLLAVRGAASTGTVVMFISYEMQLLWPVRQLAHILSDTGKVSVSIDRLREIDELPEEVMLREGKTPDIEGDIVFKNVSFTYPDIAGKENASPALEDISFSIKKGQRVGILGPTGSGKSSLIGLLLRLYDYDGGSITVDDTELREIEKGWLRQKIGLVPQDVFLFSRSVEENIAIAASSYEPGELDAAVDIAQLTKSVSGFSRGYRTMVGERGVTLSGGQKQRIAIARTILGGYPVLIFDDSLSAVDTVTDAAIRKALKQYSRDLTTIIISHRITTLFDSDLILVIENGHLTQKGTHSELIEQDGFYRRIWQMQQEDAGENRTGA